MIFVRIQGVARDAYLTYLSGVTTRNSDEKTSKMVRFIFSEALSEVVAGLLFTSICPGL